MKTFSSDFAYRAAEQKRKRDMHEYRHILSEGVAWAIVTLVTVGMFALSVLEVRHG